MEKSFKEALKHRRTYYAITNQSPISDKEIEEIIDFAVTHVPSAFNSQSTRVVLLLGDNHRKLWQIVKNTLWKIVTPEAFKNTEAKIDHSFCPYPKTYHPGYEALLIKGMKEILDTPNSPVLSLIDPKKVCEFLKAPAEYGKPWFGQLMAGPQLIAYFIQINYWMEKYNLSI